MRKEFQLSEYEEVIRLVLDHEGEFRLYPKGISMLPFIRQKKDSVVLVKPTLPLKKYDIILYKRENGQYVLHRILKEKEDGYVLCGDNQYVMEYIEKTSQIIAVVKAIWREDNYISSDKLKHSVYVWVYCGLLPLRRSFLRMKDILGKIKKRFTK